MEPNKGEPKTAEIVRKAKKFLAGGPPAEDLKTPAGLKTLLTQLRMRKQHELVRKVIEKACAENETAQKDPDFHLLKAFSYFKDYTLSDKERWEGAEESLKPLNESEKTELSKAIQRERDIQEGRTFLHHTPGAHLDFEKILACAKKLKGHGFFTYARRLFERARALIPDTHPQVDYIRQQRALCTYKDFDLPLIQRLDKALHILNGSEKVILDPDADELPEGHIKNSRDPETLGLAGAIYKRKWEAEGRKTDLEKSLEYYRRGHEEDMARVVNLQEICTAGEKSPGDALPIEVNIKPGHKYGYPGINAAFVLDLLADLEKSDLRKKEAQNIRKKLTDYLSALIRVPGPEEKIPGFTTDDRWWIRMTLVEGYFGLKEYEKASPILQDVKDSSGIEPWKFESSIRQLVRLVELQGVEIESDLKGGKSVRQLLEDFLGSSLPFLDNVVRGKIGLALSGGGFRASFFHIGVLAKLAELDLLRHVEVISCVSGGSIVAAHYYLEVRRLLQSQKDEDIEPQQYIDIVKRVVGNFTKGTQKNIRMRVFGNLLANIKMLIFPTYSRTVRAGELFEKKLYSHVHDGEEDDKRWLNDLFIEPRGVGLAFRPKSDNQYRKNKVPILVINATTLNTGNNWQFTASWMGEPPAASEKELDGKTRLRRLYYHEAPGKHQKLRLGKAVAASACVPGLFEPIILANLYENHTVRLVDGGVYDNQGISGLLDQDCNVLLVSDASGQISADKQPGTGIFKPLFRSNMITMERVRKAQLREIDVKHRARLLAKGIEVHLKKDLGIKHVNWLKCQDPIKDDSNLLALTGYGVLRPIQECLAATRTDLDSFSDLEAYALMSSGYKMTEHAAKTDLKDIVSQQRLDNRDISIGWDFLKVEDAMGNTTGVGKKHDYLKKILDVSKSRFCREFKLSPFWSFTWLILVLVLLAGAGFCLSKFVIPLISWQFFLLGFGGFLGLLILGKFIINLIKFKTLNLWIFLGTITTVISAVFSIIFWFFVHIHLWIFDRMFIKYGDKKHI